ncbi:hypothetical protein FJZ19_02505 [Candidatus Pacearchaeota archaeon]|nr:hypothetical protein [Candidatus Pacearchaeota archaeon]
MTNRKKFKILQFNDLRQSYEITLKGEVIPHLFIEYDRHTLISHGRHYKTPTETLEVKFLYQNSATLIIKSRNDKISLQEPRLKLSSSGYEFIKLSPEERAEIAGRLSPRARSLLEEGLRMMRRKYK